MANGSAVPFAVQHRRGRMNVAVIGGAGYAAGELLRLLLQHPEVTECVATSRSHAGKAIAEVHPGLAPLPEARFSGMTPGQAAQDADVVFLALEHGESSRVAGGGLGGEPPPLGGRGGRLERGG